MAEFTDEDGALLEELGVEVEAKKESNHTPLEERIMAGFEEVQRFYERYGRCPQHGLEADILERIYAVRLDRLRAQQECHELIVPLDHQRLLSGPSTTFPILDDFEDDQLLAELGVTLADQYTITELRHVRSSTERREAEEIAHREKCLDFDRFKPLFTKIQQELDTGSRQTRPFELKAEIQVGSWFILEGQKAYVAEKAVEFTNPQGRTDARLRVIFDNGTQSGLLMRSLQRALNKDEAGRRITDPIAGPLFSGIQMEDDQASGMIYVLRSKSDHPIVAANRDIVHKIGVTNLSIEQRIAGAHLQPTFLMAGVEVVATYKLFNVNRTKLENLLHRIFGSAQLSIEIKDRFGKSVIPKEWFMVPRFIIDEAVEKIKAGTIINYVYDPKSVSLVNAVID